MNISTKENPIFPYQKKIIDNVNSMLMGIDPGFKDLNPILSGTYLINLVVSPLADYSDYDFYFQDAESYAKADELLSACAASRYASKNCTSFRMSNNPKQIQIIRSYHGSPGEIILSHDLVNAQIAFLNDCIYFTTGFIKSWMYDTLELNNFQIVDTMSPEQKLLKYSSTVFRLKKYLTRYNLSISENTRTHLIALKIELKKNYSNNKDLVNLRKQDIHYNFQDIKVTVFSQLITLIGYLIDQESASYDIVPF